MPRERMKALVERLRRRDEPAFAELMDLHSPWTLRAATVYAQNRATTEEAMQQARLNGRP
jgi:hypothetical protein